MFPMCRMLEQPQQGYHQVRERKGNRLLWLEIDGDLQGPQGTMRRKLAGRLISLVGARDQHLQIPRWGPALLQ